MSDYQDRGSYALPKRNNNSGRAGGVAQYSGPVLGEEVVREVEMWARILPPLFEGISKPNSVIYELAKIDKMEEKSGKDMSEARDLVKKCCPPNTTVQDSLEFKGLRQAIVDRIVDITGIDSYYKYRK